MSKKYESPLTAKITPDNWQELINPSDLTLDEMIALRWDFGRMEKFGKKLAGYMKELVKARMPDDSPMSYSGTAWATEFIPTARKANLDESKLVVEFIKLGVDKEEVEALVESCRKPDIKYNTMKVSKVEADE